MRRFFGAKWFPYLLLLVALLFASVVIVYFVDLRGVWAAVWGVNWGYIGLSLGALFMSTIFFALRWWLLLEKRPRFWYTFHTANVGHAVNAVVPMRAGEVVRIGIMGGNRRLGLGYTAVVLSYLVERMFEQIMRLAALGVVIFAGTGEFLTPHQIASIIAPLLMGFLLLLIAFIKQNQIRQYVPPLFAQPRWPWHWLTQERVQHGLDNFFRNLNAVSSPWRLIQIFFLSGVVWFWGALYHLLVLLAMGDTFAPEQWVAITFGSLALSPPSATTQPIVFQSIVTAPLALVGFDWNDIFAYAVLLNGTQAFLFIMLGLLGLTQLKLSWRVLRQMLAQGDKIRAMIRRTRQGNEQ
jgi:uncharacterized protein (TIRG00374 family)